MTASTLGGGAISAQNIGQLTCEGIEAFCPFLISIAIIGLIIIFVMIIWDMRK